MSVCRKVDECMSERSLLLLLLLLLLYVGKKPAAASAAAAAVCRKEAALPDTLGGLIMKRTGGNLGWNRQLSLPESKLTKVR
jgi:hypothetical protein